MDGAVPLPDCARAGPRDSSHKRGDGVKDQARVLVGGLQHDVRRITDSRVEPVMIQ